MTTKYEPGARVSEYVLEECIGAGTFGEVWRARHHVWDKECVAIKLPTEPEYMGYLRREGVVVHGLRHPNVIRVMGLDPYAETPYLVMELVSGPSLRQVLDENEKGLDVGVALTILRGLLAGVGAAHAGNVVHRDLKPGNILLDLDGRDVTLIRAEDVKIGDFGLGVADADALRSMVMQSGSIEREDQGSVIAGTLVYMSPEIREGHSEPTTQSDLYAVGVILFEMLTGERPAGAELPSTIRAEVPPALDEMFGKLYAHRDRRYATAEEVLADLDRFESDRQVKAAVAPPPPPPPVRQRTGLCNNCGQPVETDDQFCTQCGTQMAERIARCPSCGGYPGPHDRFCIFCGTSLPGG